MFRTTLLGLFVITALLFAGAMISQQAPTAHAESQTIQLTSSAHVLTDGVTSDTCGPINELISEGLITPEMSTGTPAGYGISPDQAKFLGGWTGHWAAPGKTDDGTGPTGILIVKSISDPTAAFYFFNGAPVKLQAVVNSNKTSVTVGNITLSLSDNGLGGLSVIGQSPNGSTIRMGQCTAAT
ncbi:MAG TPA: hypothetical protein VG965_02175 [Patescibacteria group bacterium]|nr:hypothetical protein [Patescibacteria group bacterium]